LQSLFFPPHGARDGEAFDAPQYRSRGRLIALREV